MQIALSYVMDAENPKKTRTDKAHFGEREFDLRNAGDVRRIVGRANEFLGTTCFAVKYEGQSHAYKASPIIDVTTGAEYDMQKNCGHRQFVAAFNTAASENIHRGEATPLPSFKETDYDQSLR